MKIRRTSTPQQTTFILEDVPHACHTILEKWDYHAVEGGYAKTFPADTPHLEAIYRQFSHCMESILFQALGLQPAPWQPALCRVLDLLAGQPVDWFLGGSTALAVRGVDVQPRDVDLVADAAGALRIGEILSDFLFEPMTRYTDWICDWKGHAFLGARVEWVGGVHAAIDADTPSDFGPLAASRLVSLAWQGYRLRAAPLEMQLQVSRQRGLWQRAAAIEAAIQKGIQ